MTDEVTGSTGGEAIADLPADAPESFESPRAAADYFASLVDKRKTPAESADTATAENELSVEDNAAPLDEAHGEDKEADPVAEPPIERPKSWTESEDAEWQATPRALQQKIVARELERDTALRRTQNDAAEKLKGLTVKEQQAEQARQQYESKLPVLMQSLVDQNNQNFSNIKSMADVEFLANEALRLSATDPVLAGQYQAYLAAWNVHQQKMAVTKAEMDQADGRKAQEHQASWSKHVQDEMARGVEFIPELADKEKTVALIKRAENEFLPQLGFTKSEIDALSIGKERLSIFDHRVLRMISDGMKYADIKAAPKAIADKPVPPVQRPGTARPSGQAIESERIQALNRKPELTVKEATELYTLQNRSQRRAS